MMMAELRRGDSRGLGWETVVKNEGMICEGVPFPPQKTPAKNTFDPKPNHLRNKLDTILDPPASTTPANNFQKRVIFVGESSGLKPSEKPGPKGDPKPKPVRYHCGFCGKDGHQEEFCFRKKREMRREKEMGNRDRYRSSHSVPEPRAPLPRGDGFVRSIPREDARGFAPRGRVPQRRGGFARRPPPRGQYEFRRDDRGFGYRREPGPRFPPRGVPPVRRERFPQFDRFGRVDFANPSFEQMAQHWFDSFCSNPSVESFAHSRSRF
jgi:hypothetical protein